MIAKIVLLNKSDLSAQFTKYLNFFFAVYLVVYLISSLFAKLGLNRHRAEYPISWEKLYERSPKIMLFALVASLVFTVYIYFEDRITRK